MSGVIDDNGVQWEHCHGCSDWVKIRNLAYMPPTASHPYGLDLCQKCADTVDAIGEHCDHHPDVHVIQL